MWIVFILLCLPSIYLAHRMEADRPPGQGSDDEEDDEEQHELIERRSGSEEGEHEMWDNWERGGVIHLDTDAGDQIDGGGDDTGALE